VEQVSQLGNPDQLVKDNGAVEKWRSLSNPHGAPMVSTAVGCLGGCLFQGCYRVLRD
jgi:hypothetical protein